MLVAEAAAAEEFDAGKDVMDGWKGWRPLGVSAETRKCPEKGGPTDEGRVSGSTW